MFCSEPGHNDTGSDPKFWEKHDFLSRKRLWLYNFKKHQPLFSVETETMAALMSTLKSSIETSIALS